MDRILKNDIKDYIIYSTLKAFVNCDEILWDINVISYDGSQKEAYYIYYILNYVLNIHPPYYQELSLDKCREYLENFQNAIDAKNYIKLPDIEDSIFKSSSSIPISETPNHALNNKDNMVQMLEDTKLPGSTISPDNMEFDSQIIPLTSIIDSEPRDDCDDIGWEVAAASTKRRPHARIRPLTALGGIKMTWSKYFLPPQGDQEPGNDKKQMEEEDGGDGTKSDNSQNSRPKYLGRGRGGIWSIADEDKLMELVRLGGKDWCKYYNEFPFRTNVNLKDKYRQLEKCGRVRNYLEEMRHN